MFNHENAEIVHTGFYGPDRFGYDILFDGNSQYTYEIFTHEPATYYEPAWYEALESNRYEIFNTVDDAIAAAKLEINYLFALKHPQYQ